MKRNNVLKGFFWRFAERCGAQGVTFIVSIVLARLLLPEDYGTISLVTIFTTILNVFVDSGLGNALIQKKKADDIDFSTVFYFNIIVCCILYFVMFSIAPFIAKFYEKSELVPVIRVLSLMLVISGVKNVQQAYVSRNMLFKLFFFSTLCGTIGAAIIGIAMAYLGFGVWALVTQQIFNAAMDTLVLWISVKWRPKRIFSFKRLKSLLGYGWKLLVSALINTTYENLRSLIIGKMYSSSELAYYNQGNKFPHVIVSNINSSIDSVLLPAMSCEQDNRNRVREMTRQSISISTYIMAPFLMGLAFIAKPVIELVLTEKWFPCVPFLRIFCITYMFYPVHTSNLNAINALGRTDLFLKLEIAKKIVGIAALLSTMWISVEAMAYSLLATSAISQIINSWPNRKLLNYGYVDQLKDILPGIMLSVFMGGCIYFIPTLSMPNIVALLIQITLGAVIYVGGSAILKIQAFLYLWSIIKSVLETKFIKNRKGY